MTTPELPESADLVSSSEPVERRKGAWLRPAAVIAAVALALLGWQWLETRQRLADVQEELAKRLADNDAAARETRALARQTQEAQAALQAKVGVLEGQLADIQGQQVALDSVYRELSKNSDERLLAEVEQSVAIAAQQLRLAGNVEVALIALSGADARLARAARPPFANLRKLIQRDIERLKAQPGADVPAMSAKVEGVVAVVDTLPLTYERRPPVEPPPPAQAATGFWRAMAADFWHELRQMVRVERIDTPGHADPALLSPSQDFFLRENLRLRLVDARLALLTRDGRTFRDDVREAILALERYFDANAKPVQASLASLRAVQGVAIGGELPTLDETINAVRSLKVAREKK